MRQYGAKYTVFAMEVNGTSYERLTLHGIRRHTQPGDRILCDRSDPFLCRWRLWVQHRGTDQTSKLHYTMTWTRLRHVVASVHSAVGLCDVAHSWRPGYGCGGPARPAGPGSGIPPHPC